MDNSQTFRNIAYVGSLFLIVGLFIQFDNNLKQATFDLIYNLIAISIFIFVYLWLRKRIILIGLIFYGISWNIHLLINPLTILESLQLYNINYWLINTIISAIGLLCLLLGLSDNFKHDYMTKRMDFNVKTTIGFLIGFTALIQLVIRITM